MVSQGNNAKDWRIEVLTTSHNGDNESELERIRKSHPGEPECVVERRVLGALAPTRCTFHLSSSFFRKKANTILVSLCAFQHGTTGFGDIPFKQPPAFTRRILYNLFPGFHNTSPWEEFLNRNRTPPYITAEPQITHRRLDGSDDVSTSAPPTRTATPTTSIRSSLTPSRSFFWTSRSSAKAQQRADAAASSSSPRFLILASDGFADLCEGEGQKRIIESWARSMVTRNPPKSITDSEPGSRQDNMALRLLRRAVGGDDRFGVSRVLTLDMDVAWIDDTSLVVQTL